MYGRDVQAGGALTGKLILKSFVADAHTHHQAKRVGDVDEVEDDMGFGGQVRLMVPAHGLHQVGGESPVLENPCADFGVVGAEDVPFGFHE